MFIFTQVSSFKHENLFSHILLTQFQIFCSFQNFIQQLYELRAFTRWYSRNLKKLILDPRSSPSMFTNSGLLLYVKTFPLHGLAQSSDVISANTRQNLSVQSTPLRNREASTTEMQFTNFPLLKYVSIILFHCRSATS